MEDWFGAIVCWVCAAIMLGIALYALRRREPMNFWSGTKVDPGSIRDVRAYNRANGRLWAAYGLLWVLVGVLFLLGFSILGGILIAVLGLGGIPVLVLSYERILKRYQKE